jgi:hemolysin III
MRIPEGELAHTVTHAVAWAFSMVGAALLMGRVLETDDPWRIAGCAIFSLGLIAVYSASTLSHGVATPGPRKFFRMLDQGSIYVLIVGTYTPFAFAYLRTPIWWAYFALMWGVALWGLVMKLLIAHRVDSVTLWSYIMLGWMPVVPMICLIGTLPNAAIAWVLAGGISYTLGTVFFALDDRRYHCHAIWHTMAMGGSACHFVSIYWFVAQLPPQVRS